MSNPAISHSRASRTSTLELGGHQLSLASIENPEFKRQGRVWKEHIQPFIDTADTIFLPYFAPDLEQRAFSPPLIGRLARYYFKRWYGVYEHMAESAAAQQKKVIVPDIAATINYAPYDIALPHCYLTMLGPAEIGPFSVKPGKLERIIPSAADARRMLTAGAITQTLRSQENKMHALYVAAPAHVNRVEQYLSTEPSKLDHLRYSLYQNWPPDIEKTMRHYEYVKQSWIQTDEQRIQSPFYFHANTTLPGATP